MSTSEGPSKQTCSRCGAPMVWEKTERGRWMPLNPDGQPHWATCPYANEFRRERRKRRARK